MTPPKVIRLAAMGDLHYGRTSQGALRAAFAEINDSADILILCGDLTDYGLPEEARLLVQDLAAVRIPIVAVLGNHDFESDQVAEIARIFTDHGIILLDGDSCEIAGVGFAGIKGFAGGFGPGALGPWGERIIKQFVQEALDEALKLESALARLRTSRRVAVLHYAPVQATVEGEPPPIFPYLGSSRLEEPLNRFGVDVVFHGHAHHGTLAGQTQAGIPVYNVSHSLLQREQPDQRPYFLFELPVEGERAEGE
jgi:Icc-related predicted phosphoesterase